MMMIAIRQLRAALLAHWQTGEGDAPIGTFSGILLPTLLLFRAPLAG